MFTRTTIQSGTYTSFTVTGPFIGEANASGGAKGIGHPPAATSVDVVLITGGLRPFKFQYGDTITLTPTGDLVIEQQ